MQRAGFSEARLDGSLYTLDELRKTRMDRDKRHTVEAVVRNASRKKSRLRREEAHRVHFEALELGDGFLTAHVVKKDEDILLSQRLACSFDGISLPSIEPRIFSFNSPHGACPSCTGSALR